MKEIVFSDTIRKHYLGITESRVQLIYKFDLPIGRLNNLGSI